MHTKRDDKDGKFFLIIHVSVKKKLLVIFDKYIIFIGEVIAETEHNHASNSVDIEVRKVVNKLKRKAAKSQEPSTRSVIQKSVLNVPNVVAAKLPHVSSMSRTVQRIRCTTIHQFPTPVDLGFMIIPDSYRVTVKSDQFLLRDNNDSSSKRFLIFSTHENLKMLKKCGIWLADETFNFVPTIFTQLYTFAWFS